MGSIERPHAAIDLKSVREHCARAISCAKSGDPSGVLVELGRARNAATNADEWVEIGRTYEELHDTSSALHAFRHATQLDRRHGEAHRALGSRLLADGDTGAAVAPLRIALAAEVKPARTALLLSRALWALGRRDEALAYAKRAQDANPLDPESDRELSRMTAEMSPSAEVLPSKSAARSEPMGDSINLLHELERLHARNPEDVAVAVDLADALTADGRREQAREVLRRAASGPIATVDLENRLCGALLALGQTRDAMNRLRDALSSYPRSAELHLRMVREEIIGGDLAGALTRLHTALSLRPDSAPALAELGLLYRRMGDLKRAVHSLVRAAALVPDDVRIQTELETTLRERDAEEDEDETKTSGSFTGDLPIVALADMLEFLMNRESTGILEVEGPSSAGTIELVRGRVARVASPGHTESLPALVARAGVLEQGEVERLLSEIPEPASDANIANALVASSVVSEEQLAGLLESHAQSALEELLSWTSGGVRFTQKAESEIDHSDSLLMDSRQLLSEARHVAEGHLTSLVEDLV